MWTCPDCGRSFKNKNQGHYCGKKAETVDEYILSQDEAIQQQLEDVRQAIGKGLPQATEKIAWSMPTFWQGRNLIHFAANKHHIGLYPGAQVVQHFSKILSDQGFKFSKGSIQIPYSENLPLDLITEIASWCGRKGEKGQ